VKDQPAEMRERLLAMAGFAHTARKKPDLAFAAVERLAALTTHPDATFEAARVSARCVPLADRPETAERYAVRAVALLRQAVARGYGDLERIRNHADFEPLRSCDDFKAFLRELEGKKGGVQK